MPAAVCSICVSPIRGEIEKRAVDWQADETVRWAKERGVRISKTSLARHRKTHQLSTEDKFLSPEVQPKIPTILPVDADTVVKTGLEPKISDMLFLDAVRDRVYDRLIRGEIELKIDSGFKAIELKNKIGESSQNEKLLLEILSEIRADELKRSR